MDKIKITQLMLRSLSNQELEKIAGGGPDDPNDKPLPWGPVGPTGYSFRDPTLHKHHEDRAQGAKVNPADFF